MLGEHGVQTILYPHAHLVDVLRRELESFESVAWHFQVLGPIDISGPDPLRDHVGHTDQCPPDSQVYNEAQAERAWSRLLVLFESALA